MADRVILVVNEINAAFGESVLMLHCAGRSRGYFILNNFITLEQIAPLIKGTVLEHYSVVEGDPIKLREGLLEEAERHGNPAVAARGGGGALPVDHYFNVKGVGVVVLGCVSHRG